jgi:hypothetical protein
MHEYEEALEGQLHAKERCKRLGRATLANLGLFAFTTAVSVLTNNKAFFAEAMHDGGDTLLHGSSYGVEAKGIDQNTKKMRFFRRAGFFMLSGLSAWTAIRLGLDFRQWGSDGWNGSREVIELGSAVVVAAGNIYAYDQLDEIENHSNISKDRHGHARTDMRASVGLAAFIAADAVGLNGAAEFGGAAFATYTAAELARIGITLEDH